MVHYGFGCVDLRGQAVPILIGVCFAFSGVLPVLSAQEISARSDGTTSPQPQRPSFSARTPPGLVYFVGTVERVSGTVALIDLGNVHTLKHGSVVTVFRSRDGQFSPLGNLTVSESFATWMLTEPAMGFAPQAGDLILTIRTIGEIGTGTAHQDRFLTLQHVKNQNRNGYNTVRSLAIAESLLDIRLQQPRWFQYDNRIAGIVTGETLRDDGLSKRAELLLEQINLFRRLQEDGFPVAAAAGPVWEQVMQQLQGPAPDPEIILTKQQPETRETISEKSETIPAVEIQLMVSRIFFDRTPEEQAIASAMCAAMLRGVSRNDPEWLRRELQHCQLPQLADDLQFRSDAISVVRQLREKQQ